MGSARYPIQMQNPNDVTHCSEKRCYAQATQFGADGFPYCAQHLSDHLVDTSASQNNKQGSTQNTGQNTTQTNLNQYGQGGSSMQRGYPLDLALSYLTKQMFPDERMDTPEAQAIAHLLEQQQQEREAQRAPPRAEREIPSGHQEEMNRLDAELARIRAENARMQDRQAERGFVGVTRQSSPMDRRMSRFAQKRIQGIDDDEE